MKAAKWFMILSVVAVMLMMVLSGCSEPLVESDQNDHGFSWDGGSYTLVAEGLTNGGSMDIGVIEYDGKRYLVVANNLSYGGGIAVTPLTP